MKNKKDDCAAELVSSDKEVNYVGATPCVSALCVSRLDGARGRAVARGRVTLTANRFGEGPASEADDREEENGYYTGRPPVGGIVAPGFGALEQLGRGGHGSATTRDRRGGQEVSSGVQAANLRMVGG